MNGWWYLIGITLLPGIELRGSIPIGIAYGFNPLWVFLLLTLVNIAIIVPLLLFLEWFFHLVEKINIVDFFVRRTRKKAGPYVKKYGVIGLALFVGVPLPGTGAYTGALAAHLLGLDKKRAFFAIAMGVLIAGSIVTLISTIFKETWGWVI